MLKRFLAFLIFPLLLQAQAPKVVPVTRTGKGTQLTIAEGDKNFTDLSAAANASIRAWGPKDSTTTGLVFGYYGGPAFNGTAWTNASDGTVTLTGSTTNYVERTLAGVVTANTTGWTTGKIPMAQLVTGGSTITTTLDFRQGAVADAQVFKHSMQNAVGRSMAQRAADWVSVKDWGAKGDGSTDDTTAIQTALDAVYAITLGTVSDDFGVRNAGAATLWFPRGVYKTTGTLETYQNIRMVGDGRYSTIIQSTVNGHILRNKMPGTQYGPSGISIENLMIQGDRTKASQIGIALLRAYRAYFNNVTVQECGSHGVAFYQCVNNQIDALDTHKNVGSGLVLDEGFNSWSDATLTNLPSIGNTFHNIHAGFNDAPGVVLKGRTDGNIFYGGSSEQNNQQTARAGYQIDISGVCVTPSEFVDFYSEATNGLALVYVHLSTLGDPARFTRFHHYGTGTSGNLDRAFIVTKGTLTLDRPFGSSVSYRTIGASSVPFRLTKADAYIFLNEPVGCFITNGVWVEDETNTTTALINNVFFTSLKYTYGPNIHKSDTGNETQLFQVDTEAYPWAAFESFYKSLTLSGGTADKSTQGARLQWLSTKAMGIADGHRIITDWVSADRGDTSPTLTVGTDRVVQRFATTLTANRTITLSTSGAVNGDRFRIVRTGLGSFTLAVGSVKTIPSATAAFVEVEFDGTAWQLVGYGTL